MCFVQGVGGFPEQFRAAVAEEPRRWGVLWAQDRHYHLGRAAPLAPVRHHPARFPAARAVQPQLRQVYTNILLPLLVVIQVKLCQVYTNMLLPALVPIPLQLRQIYSNILLLSTLVPMPP
jgi:hypothetical protein